MSYHLASRSPFKPALMSRVGHRPALPRSAPRAGVTASADRLLLLQVLLCVVPTVLLFIFVGPRLGAM